MMEWGTYFLEHEADMMLRLIRGGVAGVLATGAMTVVIAGARAARLMPPPPPKEITARLQQKVGINPHTMPEPAFHASWLAAHIGYGAASGAVYTVVRPLLPRHWMLAGLLYGGAVWAISYCGLLPALELYPSPKYDSAARMAVMICAHGVYGTSLSALAE